MVDVRFINDTTPITVTAEQQETSIGVTSQEDVATVNVMPTGRHDTLSHRNLPNQHPISAITGLQEALDSVQSSWGHITGDLSDQTDLKDALDAKQDTISDLSTIRSGAALGATAVQSVTEGTANGTIKVDGNSVSVHGLGSAAYTASTAYDASGSASTAETNAKNYADSLADNYATAAQGALADTAVQPSDLATVATSGSYNDLSNKPTIPTVNNATLTIQKNTTTAGTFTANASSDTTINIVVPTTASDVSALPDSTKYGAGLSLSINSSTYVITAQLKDQDGNNLGSAQTIDLPLESVVVSGSYDDQTKKIILTLQNGSTIEFSVADLVSGLQTEITAQNMLDADLVDDSTSTNKFVTSSEKSAISTAVQPADLATVATSGSYTDLSNKPTIPTDTGDLTNNAGFITGITSSDVTTALGYTPYSSSNPSGYTSNVGTVTSVNNTSPDSNGNVTLSIPAAQVNSDWNAVSGVAEILNKPSLATVATSGAYSDLSGTPTIPTVNNATLTITQGGVSKGTFTANASSDVTIDLDAGGGGGSYTEGTGIDITSGVISVTSPTLTNNTTHGLSILGTTSNTNTTTSIGKYASATGIGSIAISDCYGVASASGTYATCVGGDSSATGTAATAFGSHAKATANYAIQLGYGTNSEANSFYVSTSLSDNWKMLGSDGKIPAARLPIATSVSSSSTNDESVGAKVFYDTCGDIETLINAL